MLFKNAKGFMVEAEAPLTDPVQFHPQGGGFVYSTPKAKFETNFSPAPKPAMRKVRVTGDWMDDDADPIEAFANDMRWNGWAMPYFALENAKLVTATMPDITYRIAPQCSIHNALAASAAQRRSRRAWMVVKRRTLRASAGSVSVASWRTS